jgi:hypothetical protein
MVARRALPVNASPAPIARRASPVVRDDTALAQAEGVQTVYNDDGRRIQLVADPDLATPRQSAAPPSQVVRKQSTPARPVVVARN